MAEIKVPKHYYLNNINPETISLNGIAAEILNIHKQPSEMTAREKELVDATAKYVSRIRDILVIATGYPLDSITKKEARVITPLIKYIFEHQERSSIRKRLEKYPVDDSNALIEKGTPLEVVAESRLGNFQGLLDGLKFEDWLEEGNGDLIEFTPELQMQFNQMTNQAYAFISTLARITDEKKRSELLEELKQLCKEEEDRLNQWYLKCGKEAGRLLYDFDEGDMGRKKIK